MNTKKSLEELQEMVDQLSDIPRTIKVEEAMRRWGYKSKNTAYYFLKKLCKLGLIEYEKTGITKGEYFLP